MNIDSSLEFDLHELTASDRRIELQYLLVDMGRLIETLQTNLTGIHTYIHNIIILPVSSHGYYRKGVWSLTKTSVAIVVNLSYYYIFVFSFLYVHIKELKQS